MNSLVKTQFPVLDQTMILRHQLMDVLSDNDLSFQIEGNPTLGELCKEMGEIEHSYIDSFKTLQQKWDYQQDDAYAHDVSKLKAWYTELDAEFKDTLRAFSNHDIGNKIVVRNEHMQIPVGVQFHIYREGLLIFYAKVSVYLKAMGKPLPGDWVQWIG